MTVTTLNTKKAGISFDISEAAPEGYSLSTITYKPETVTIAGALSDIRSNFRIAHLHANLPGVLAKVNRVLGEENINIAAQALGTEGEIGYVVTDVAQRPSQKALDELAAIEGTIRMRVIS